MENILVIKQPYTSERSKGDIKKPRLRLTINRFYLKKRCVALYLLFALGIVLISFQVFVLGSLLMIFSVGLLYILKDLDEAFAIDLNFKRDDPFNDSLNQDLKF